MTRKILKELVLQKDLEGNTVRTTIRLSRVSTYPVYRQVNQGTTPKTELRGKGEKGPRTSLLITS